MPGPKYVKDFEFPASFGFTGSARNGPHEVRFMARGGKAAKLAKVAQVMDEFKTGDLHSGSKHGPMVKNRKQAVAIALSEAGLSKKARGGRIAEAKRAQGALGVAAAQRLARRPAPRGSRAGVPVHNREPLIK